MLRHRFLLPIAVLAVAIALSMATPASASTGTARAKVFHFVNHYRLAHGRHALRESRDVDRLAQHHSQLMASESKLFHSSSLSTKLRSHDPIPTVERGLWEVPFWSMETAGERPSM